jgi:hypothetical protein
MAIAGGAAVAPIVLGGGSLGVTGWIGGGIAVDYGQSAARGFLSGRFEPQSTVGGTAISYLTDGEYGEGAYAAATVIFAGGTTTRELIIRASSSATIAESTVVNFNFNYNRYSLTAPSLAGFEGTPGTIRGLVGPVRLTVPAGATPEEIAQIHAYAAGSNQAIFDGALSPTGRVSTQGTMRVDASLAAAQERARATAAGTPHTGHAGHVPDTTWTGNPQPHSWLDLSPRVNTSLGGQVNRYPVGWKPTIFIVE